LYLTSCATFDENKMRNDLESRHLAWSNKTSGFATDTQDVSVTMNQYGLMTLYVNGQPVVIRVNWCVEIVEYIP
jgi:hypothetical protein